MKMQALNSNGEWMDIEYLPSSWCGNSYHSVELPQNHFWELAALRYEGSFKTRLRIDLTYVDPTDTKGLPRRDKNFGLDWTYRERRELKVDSNEFQGYVNPGQFWRKEEYFPRGLMDPYDE
jgi:hypothetical protein